MLAFLMIKLGITVDGGQRLMEAVFIGPVGNMVHILEGILPFMQIGESLFPN